MNNHYRQSNGTFHETLPAFHWLSPINKVALTEQNALEHGYELATEHPHEYGKWLIESGVFLQSVNNEYDTLCKAQIAKYSETERLTWADQEREALAHIANVNTNTPVLDALCVQRGFDSHAKLALANRIVTNANYLRTLAAHGLGMVQACEDAIKKLDKETVTHEDVFALRPAFSILGV